MTEFELIRTFFASSSVTRSDVAVPVGDDAAVVDVPPGMQTVLATDVLVAGVHFFDDVDPAALGHKALAVNLSDLAAMGAEPAWFLLDLTLPHVDTAWLAAFAQGMYALARRHDVQLIGGDTSRGPLAVAVTVAGLVPRGAALRRAGARPGDGVYVTGTLGDAAFALAERVGTPRCTTAERALLDERLERPTPRVAEGLALRGVASSAIDISDGLLADLGHVLAASGVGARLQLDAIPLSATYRRHLREIGWDAALAGGDDYELCFTVPAANEARLAALAAERGFAATRIGEITAGEGVAIYDEAGRRYEPARRGHEHFR
ncbi:MAG TPA: thiamine-phosphate kinase [Burkholderiales bacterium]